MVRSCGELFSGCLQIVNVTLDVRINRYRVNLSCYEKFTWVVIDLYCLGLLVGLSSLLLLGVEPKTVFSLKVVVRIVKLWLGRNSYHLYRLYIFYII